MLGGGGVCRSRKVLADLISVPRRLAVSMNLLVRREGICRQMFGKGVIQWTWLERGEIVTVSAHSAACTLSVRHGLATT